MEEKDQKLFDYDWESLKKKGVDYPVIQIVLKQMAQDRGGPADEVVEEYCRLRMNSAKFDKVMAQTISGSASCGTHPPDVPCSHGREFRWRGVILDLNETGHLWGA